MAMLLLVLPACDGGSPAGVPLGEYPVRPVKVKPFRFAPDVVLLLTGASHGTLESCNCTGVLPGGLSRRGGLLASYRAMWPDSVTVDVGDLFWIQPDRLRGRFLLRGLQLLDYDAVVLGDQEWNTPVKDLSALLAGAAPAGLSTNVHARDGSVPVTGVLRRKTASAAVAVLSYVDADAFLFARTEVLEQTVRRHDLDALAGEVARLKSQGAIVAVVVHGTRETAAAVAEKAPAIDVIVRGHTAKTDKRVDRVNGVPIVRVGGREYVGVLALQCRDGKVTDLQWRAELVTTDWPADRRLAELYQAYVHAALRKAQDAKRTAGLDYVTGAECGKCHQDQHRQWLRRGHARAYRSLAKAKRAGDPNCLMCHTTGFGTESGFHSIAKTPELTGVHCQGCHRFNVDEHVDPAGRRIAAFKVPPANEAVCETCHTPNNSPKFNYRRYRARQLTSGHGKR